MKKLLLLLMAVALCGSANAQTGMSGVGGNFDMTIASGVAFGGKLKYQYNISDYFRIEPSVAYCSVNDGPSQDAFDLAALINMHCFVLSPRMIRPYIFVGVGYLDFKENHSSGYYGKTDNEGALGFDAGLGLDWRITHTLSLQVEATILKGLADDDMFGGKASIGISYNF